MLRMNNRIKRQAVDYTKADIINFGNNLRVGVNVLREQRNYNIFLVGIHKRDNRE